MKTKKYITTLLVLIVTLTFAHQSDARIRWSSEFRTTSWPSYKNLQANNNRNNSSNIYVKKVTTRTTEAGRLRNKIKKKVKNYYKKTLVERPKKWLKKTYVNAPKGFYNWNRKLFKSNKVCQETYGRCLKKYEGRSDQVIQAYYCVERDNDCKGWYGSAPR